MAEPDGPAPAPTAPPAGYTVDRAVWRSVALGAALGLGVGAILSWLGVVLHRGPAVALTLALPASCGALLMLVRSTFHEMQPLEQRDSGPVVRTAGYSVRLRQLERRLQAASVDGAKFDWSLRPLLAQVAAERLRHRHAITIRREPEAARAMLGEQLWQMISMQPDQPSPALSRRQLTALVEAIEAL
jgi:hypothetical protein